MISTSLIVIDVKYCAAAFPQVQIHSLLKWKSNIFDHWQLNILESSSLFQQCPSKSLIMSDMSGFNYIPGFFRADIQLRDVL